MQAENKKTPLEPFIPDWAKIDTDELKQVANNYIDQLRDHSGYIPNDRNEAYKNHLKGIEDVINQMSKAIDAHKQIAQGYKALSDYRLREKY